jgi:hypothetical protein
VLTNINVQQQSSMFLVKLLFSTMKTQLKIQNKNWHFKNKNYNEKIIKFYSMPKYHQNGNTQTTKTHENGSNLVWAYRYQTRLYVLTVIVGVLFLARWKVIGCKYLPFTRLLLCIIFSFISFNFSNLYFLKWTKNCSTLPYCIIFLSRTLKCKS